MCTELHLHKDQQKLFLQNRQKTAKPLDFPSPLLQTPLVLQISAGCKPETVTNTSDKSRWKEISDSIAVKSTAIELMFIAHN